VLCDPRRDPSPIPMPQVYSPPSAVAAIAWYCPTSMSTTPRRPATTVNVSRSSVSPRPSWPHSFNPHAMAVPSLLRAREWVDPVATATTPFSPGTTVDCRHDALCTFTMITQPQLAVPVTPPRVHCPALSHLQTLQVSSCNICHVGETLHSLRHTLLAKVAVAQLRVSTALSPT
jgi:hypothetical protein